MASITAYKGVLADWSSLQRPPAGTPAPASQPYLPNHLGNFEEASQAYSIGANIVAPAGTGIVVDVGVTGDDDLNTFVLEWRQFKTPDDEGHVLTVSYDSADELDAIGSLRLVSALTVVNELGQDRTPL